MTYTSDRPLMVDGVRLDTLAWNIEQISRAVAARREANVTIPGRDGVVPSLNDPLEPVQMGLDMFVMGTDPDGAVPPEGRRDRFWANLDELIHLFGKRHALLEVIEQIGPGVPAANLTSDPSFEGGGWITTANGALTWDTTTQRRGTRSGRLTRNATGDLYLTNGPNIPAHLVMGRRVTVSFDWKANRNDMGATMPPGLQSMPNYNYRQGVTNGAAPTTEWTRATYVVDVPTYASETEFRVILRGGPTVGDWIEYDGLTVEIGDTPALEYFDGSTSADATYTYRWTGAANASISERLPKARRRAWAKVTDTIAPEADATGSSGRFTVGLELPYAVWEDVDTQDWNGTQGAVQATQTVTTLTGATERITDALLAIQGPITNPRVTDTTTGAYVQLNGTLPNGNTFWRVNVGTWSSRTEANGVAFPANFDIGGTDQVGVTIHGGTPNQAHFLPMTPTRLDGARVVRLALSGSAMGATTRLNVRARRKFAL